MGVAAVRQRIKFKCVNEKTGQCELPRFCFLVVLAN